VYANTFFSFGRCVFFSSLLKSHYTRTRLKTTWDVESQNLHGNSQRQLAPQCSGWFEDPWATSCKASCLLERTAGSHNQNNLPRHSDRSVGSASKPISPLTYFSSNPYEMYLCVPFKLTRSYTKHKYTKRSGIVLRTGTATHSYELRGVKEGRQFEASFCYSHSRYSPRRPPSGVSVKIPIGPRSDRPPR